MNESIFSKGAFESAQPLVQPDFEVLMTLVRLRQAESPTVRALAAGRSGLVGCDDYRLDLFGEGGVDGGAAFCRSAEFYELPDIAATDCWPLERPERRVNLGISINVQTLALDADLRQ